MSLPEHPDTDGLASELITHCRDRRLTLGVAESLTGGLLADALVRVPGASAVVLGGVVAYAPSIKRTVLGVPAALLEEHGTVSRACAEAMAQGARRVLHCDVAIATTGVAGPDPSEGHAPGTVHLAVRWVDGAREERGDDAALTLCGSRADVREQAVRSALALALGSVTAPPPSTPGGGRKVP
ncbi:MAG: nicotinamide-nucleotide amidohydrolase family protein [Ornithinimicrobium sp.]